jgi:hypothetical protein
MNIMHTLFSLHTEYPKSSLTTMAVMNAAATAPTPPPPDDDEEEMVTNYILRKYSLPRRACDNCCKNITATFNINVTLCHTLVPNGILP